MMERLDSPVYTLAIRITTLPKPCHPIMRKSDGNFFAIILSFKKQKPMSNIGENPVFTGACWLIQDFQDQRLQPLGYLSRIKNQRKLL